MNPEQFNSQEQQDLTEWKAPETGQDRRAGFMQKLAKLPGAKAILTGLAALAMTGGIKNNAEAAQPTKIVQKASETNPGLEHLRSGKRINMEVQSEMAKAFGVLKEQGKETTPDTNMLVGDVVYASGAELNLPQGKNSLELRQSALAKLEKVIVAKFASNKQLAEQAKLELNNFANDLWGDDLDGEAARLRVVRQGKDGKSEVMDLKVQWCSWGEMTGAVENYTTAVVDKVSSPQEKLNYTKAFANTCGQLAKEASVINMAEVQATNSN